MIRHFEDLIIWQKSFQIAVDAHALRDRLPDLMDLTGTLLEYSLSVPADIAAGFCRGSNPEFRKYLNNAMASLGAFRTVLYLIERKRPELGDELRLRQREAAELHHQIQALYYKLKMNARRKPQAGTSATPENA